MLVCELIEKLIGLSDEQMQWRIHTDTGWNIVGVNSEASEERREIYLNTDEE